MMPIRLPCQTSPTPPETTTRHLRRHSPAVLAAQPAAPHRPSAPPFRACQPASRQASPVCSSMPGAAARFSASHCGQRSAHHCSPQRTCAATAANMPCTGWPGWRLPLPLTHRPRPTRQAVATDARHQQSSRQRASGLLTGCPTAMRRGQKLCCMHPADPGWPGHRRNALRKPELGISENLSARDIRLNIRIPPPRRRAHHANGPVKPGRLRWPCSARRGARRPDSPTGARQLGGGVGLGGDGVHEVLLGVGEGWRLSQRLP